MKNNQGIREKYEIFQFSLEFLSFFAYLAICLFLKDSRILKIFDNKRES